MQQEGQHGDFEGEHCRPKAAYHPFQVENSSNPRTPVLINKYNNNSSKQNSVFSEGTDCDWQEPQPAIKIHQSIQPGAPGGEDLPWACSPPSLFGIMWNQRLPLVFPAGILIVTVIVTITVVAPSSTVVAYLITYAITLAATILWLAFCHAVEMRRCLSSLVDKVPQLFASPSREALSTDVCVRYVQTQVYHRSLDVLHGSQHQNPGGDQLAFMQDVITMKSLDLKGGHCIADHAGTILWHNEALAAHFGWADGGLVGMNVRVLMPAPYCNQHDALMRNYNRRVASNVVGQKRRVPIVDQSGNKSTALLAVQEHMDPMDPDNYVFLASMTFSEAGQLDPASTIQALLNEGIGDVSDCCAPLATHTDSLLVINVHGIIQWANDSATWMLQYNVGELVGKNVSCLMQEEHARQHDTFLARYQQRAAAGATGTSQVIGHSRDLYAKTKSGQLVRVYITVKQLDRPSGLACDCLFLGNLLLVQKTKSELGDRQLTRTPSTMGGASCTPIRVTRVGLLSALTSRKCTLAALEITNIDQLDLEALHRDLSTFFNIANNISSRFKGVLHYPVGDRLHVSFNGTMMNASHCSNAGSFLYDACQQWKYHRQRSGARMLAVGVSGTCVVGQFITCGVMLSQMHDMSAILLRMASEMEQQTLAIIDASLFADLQFAFDCRPLNALTVLTRGKPQTQTIYELQALKVVEDDEWMYQLHLAEKDDALASWKRCWEALGPTSGFPDYILALEHLGRHLDMQPKDAVGGWLLDVLQACQAGRVVPTWEVMGKLRFMLQYRGEVAPVSNAFASFRSRRRSCPSVALSVQSE